MMRRGQEVEVSQDVLQMLLPSLERLVRELRICVETANKIVTTGFIPISVAVSLGLVAHSNNFNHNNNNAMASVGNLPVSHHAQLLQQPQQQQQHLYNSVSVSPLSLPHSSNNLVNATPPSSMGSHSKQMLGTQYHFSAVATPGGGACTLSGQLSNIQLSATTAAVAYDSNNSDSQSPMYSSSSSFSGSSSPNAYINATGGNSPLHQITKGISGLSTCGNSPGGSITRGTSAAMENANQQPLDLTMEVCIDGSAGVSQQQQQHAPANWFIPPSSTAHYDVKPLNLSPAATHQQIRMTTNTPPVSPNLCIIQEEQQQLAQLNYTISSGMPYTDCTTNIYNNNNNNNNNEPQVPQHPQICLTDVQGSEITLVAL